MRAHYKIVESEEFVELNYDVNSGRGELFVRNQGSVEVSCHQDGNILHVTMEDSKMMFEIDEETGVLRFINQDNPEE